MEIKNVWICVVYESAFAICSSFDCAKFCFIFVLQHIGNCVIRFEKHFLRLAVYFIVPLATEKNTHKKIKRICSIFNLYFNMRFWQKRFKSIIIQINLLSIDWKCCTENYPHSNRLNVLHSFEKINKQFKIDAIHRFFYSAKNVFENSTEIINHRRHCFFTTIRYWVKNCF